MPTTNPRVNVVLEEPVYEGLRRWAKRDGDSLSLKVRDLVKDALEAEEDRALADLAKDREQTLDRSKALTERGRTQAIEALTRIFTTVRREVAEPRRRPARGAVRPEAYSCRR